MTKEEAFAAMTAGKPVYKTKDGKPVYIKAIHLRLINSNNGEPKIDETVDIEGLKDYPLSSLSFTKADYYQKQIDKFIRQQKYWENKLNELSE